MNRKAMQRSAGMFAAIALLAGCGDAGEAAPAASSTAASASANTPAAEPDLAACKPSETADEDYRERKAPIPVPPAFDGLVRSDMDHFAVSTANGHTICVDTGWMEGIEDAKASHDQRFLSFAWGGYEAFGFIVVDRSGLGQVIETGTAPLSPPGGMRFASVDLSESAFGGFNAFGVWQIEPVGLRPLAKVEEGMPSGDWRLEGWAGDGCVNLSVIPNDRYPSDAGLVDITTRDPWHATEAEKWALKPGACPKP
ncbi:hypothetical protein SZ64_18030 [Erythrobacter sp. SG61-1L]|uniref:hypothetical protein n=1 Tax=Erythrobacter sp. SG61-1L TaxID=1603897 RepID=UPI0006C91F9D|nr:hypothetical protein [Erythrobacter sp. SG61-1L]KPL69716.1 hypothetical protein SZ64_17415 [Erythrobacter sp. SG61-1L]KPL69831.1 hypothetical protein SZ64_18030 [Erythrobacter sp. SG61-1L]